MASYIPGFVLQKKNDVFVSSDTVVGAILEIPTPDNGAYLDGDIWAVPVNFGVYSGWQFVPYNVNNPLENVAPSPFSVACCKVSANNTADWFAVLGTAAQYVAAAAGGTALPIVWPQRIHTSDLLPICQTISGINPTTNLYELTVGLPTIAGGTAYYPFGYFNGVALATASSSGYTTTAALLTFLTTFWNNVGTWTITGDGLTAIVTQSAGTGKDVFCGGIIPITPSL